MDDATLVARVRTGNTNAFTTLVTHHQRAAFGYAWSITNRADLAEEATQIAFLTAWRSLASLRQPDRFGPWLRGIVRFECLHLLRSRHLSQVALDNALEIADPAPAPHEIADRNETARAVQAALAQLPEAERTVAIAYYLHNQRQREVAAYLNLSIDTVNNRLRTARLFLRGQGDLQMAFNDIANAHVPDDFATRIATIVRADGVMLEAKRFADNRPRVMSQVRLGDTATLAHVAQYLDDDTIRLVMQDRHPAPVPGASVHTISEPSPLPLTHEAVAEVIDRLPHSSEPGLPITTGNKVIDAFCPIRSGGLVAVIGDMHSGKMVLVEELVHRITESAEPITVVVMVEADTEVAALRELDYRTSPLVEAIYLPVADASAGALESALNRFDTVISISGVLGARGLYPAIDPRRSFSCDPGDNLAQTIRDLLAAGTDVETIDRIERYLTQLFFVAEPYTNRPGESVPQAATLDDLDALLNNRRSDIPTAALTMIGSLSQERTR